MIFFIDNRVMYLYFCFHIKNNRIVDIQVVYIKSGQDGQENSNMGICDNPEILDDVSLLSVRLLILVYSREKQLIYFN